jgi:hypothetical protein
LRYLIYPHTLCYSNTLWPMLSHSPFYLSTNTKIFFISYVFTLF